MGVGEHTFGHGRTSIDGAEAYAVYIRARLLAA